MIFASHLKKNEYNTQLFLFLCLNFIQSSHDTLFASQRIPPPPTHLLIDTENYITFSSFFSENQHDGKMTQANKTGLYLNINKKSFNYELTYLETHTFYFLSFYMYISTFTTQLKVCSV